MESETKIVANTLSSLASQAANNVWIRITGKSYSKPEKDELEQLQGFYFSYIGVNIPQFELNDQNRLKCSIRSMGWTNYNDVSHQGE